MVVGINFFNIVCFIVFFLIFLILILDREKCLNKKKHNLLPTKSKLFYKCSDCNKIFRVKRM